jgi:hypothetical protein
MARRRLLVHSSRSLAVLWSACAASAATAQQAPAVIEYASPVTVLALPRSTPLVDLGGAVGGGTDFLRIVTIVPRRDGSFIVVNGATADLRFFEPSGALRAAAGRKGQGPGEYSGIREVRLLPGDSIAVFDPVERRLSILSPNGEYRRSFTLQAPFDGGGSATHMVALSDGTLLVGFSEVRTMAPQPQAVTIGQRFFRYSTTGGLQPGDPIRLSESDHFVQVTTPQMGGVAYWDLAFGRVMTVRAYGPSILVGDGTDWIIEERDAHGRLIRRHHVTRSVTAVTSRDRDAYRARELAGGGGAIAERMVAEMPYPRTKPAYRRCEVDGAGRIWLEVYPELDQPGNVWMRLDPRSRTAVAVQLPVRFRVMAFTSAAVYGVWRDADDVEHVQVYSLEGI